MIHKRTHRIASAVIGLTSLVASAAQGDAIGGKVLDATRLPIAQANLTLTCPNVEMQTALSGPEGEYRLPLSVKSIGTNCSLQVERSGFVTLTVQFTAGSESIEREIVLQVAPVNTAVTVSEEAGYLSPTVRSATKTLTPLRDVPQSIALVGEEQMQDQLMASVADAVRYVPGVSVTLGEGNRDQLVIRGQGTTADFYVDGVRDDVQYMRDIYNLDRVEVLKGPNAMIFGRGGGGGVINRVVKEPVNSRFQEFELSGGSFATRRFTTDFNQPLGTKWFARLNGMYEGANSFRQGVNRERYGIDPSLSFIPTDRTRLTLNFESFHDDRVADRGIPSFQGRPIDLPIEQYFGDPRRAPVRAHVNVGTAAFEHHWTNLEFRNRFSLGDYDKLYQNFVPGAVNAAKTTTSLTAYNNWTGRRNLFNQSDLSGRWQTGFLRHSWLTGMELGRQVTDNLRNTGYFNNTATSIQVALDSSRIDTPVTWRQSATDARNHLVARVAAGYIQDQIELNRYVQVLTGVRFDSFTLNYHDLRSGLKLTRTDHLVSPRVGLVLKPLTAVSVYGSYSVSYLPSSGDQFSSLTTITQQVKPEKFTNLETGLKWDIRRGLTLTSALYRLDRTNTRSIDPNDPTRIIQTGSQRTNGGEISLSGDIYRKWSVIAGYGRQNAFVSSPTVSALAGAIVGQVPRNTFSFWNRYAINSRLSMGLGLVNRSDMFAAIDNTVVLPGYTRADAAVFYWLSERIRIQANVENLTNRRYIQNADGNNQIMPGSPRAARIGIVARF
jgi:catecholate siderophore receptor